MAHAIAQIETRDFIFKPPRRAMTSLAAAYAIAISRSRIFEPGKVCEPASVILLFVFIQLEGDDELFAAVQARHGVVAGGLAVVFGVNFVIGVGIKTAEVVFAAI